MTFIPEHWTCEICGDEDPAGLGMWACVDGNHRVHTGKCWRAYEAERTMEVARKAAFLPADL